MIKIYLAEYYRKIVWIVALLLTFQFISAQDVINDPDNDGGTLAKNIPLKSEMITGALPLKNALYPLNIPTHDGFGQPTHPSVIDFKVEHAIESWAGFRYWLVMTPYPYYNAYKEDPNLVASNDGITWEVPLGLTNPLVGKPDSTNHADVDMVFNKDSNELWIYYIFRNIYGKSPSSINLVKVKADMSCSKPIVVIPNLPFKLDSTLLSPCVWRESSDSWHLWAFHNLSTCDLMYTNSTNGIDWGPLKRCHNKLGQYPFLTLGPGYKVWHAACKPNYKERRIEFIGNAKYYYSGDHPSNTAFLVYFECSMDSLTTISTPISQYIMCNSASGWDNKKLYRSSFVRVDVDTAYLYKIWYAGFNTSKVCKIGFTQGIIGTKYTPSPIINNSITIQSSKGNIICEDDSALLEVSDLKAVSYIWYRNDSIITGDGSFSLFVSQSGKYKAILVRDPDRQIVDTSQEYVFTVVSVPVPEIYNEKEIDKCPDHDITLFSGIEQINNFKWFKDSLLLDENKTEIIVSKEGIYKIEVFDKCGVFYIKNYVIQDYNADALAIEIPDTIYKSSGKIPLKLPEGISGQYYINNKEGNYLMLDTVSEGLLNITFRYADQHGCNSEARKSIIVMPEININENNMDISIYPNPANDFVNVIFSENLENNTRVEIYDQSGKIMKEEVLNKLCNTVKVSDLSSGIYFLKIYTMSQISNIPLLIMR